MHYVYLIESVTDLTRRYVGSTTDLKQRIPDHSAGKSVHTVSHRLRRLVVSLDFPAKVRPWLLSVT